MSVSILTVDAVSPEVSELFAASLFDLQTHRGGPALLVEALQTLGVEHENQLLENLVGRDLMLGVYDSDQFAGFAIVDNEVPSTVLGIFISREHRRRGLAAFLVEHLLSQPRAPRDAWALPGDRITKSLYEAAGWKARRLTMSAE